MVLRLCCADFGLGVELQLGLQGGVVLDSFLVAAATLAAAAAAAFLIESLEDAMLLDRDLFGVRVCL